MKLIQGTRAIKANHLKIGRQIAAVERAILLLRVGLVQTGGGQAAQDSNIAITLAARLPEVWRRLGRTF